PHPPTLSPSGGEGEERRSPSPAPREREGPKAKLWEGEGCDEAKGDGEASMKTLIHGGYLIPMAGDEDVVAHAGLVIEGDRILAVGPDADLAAHKADSRRVIDARGHAILPGFVNTHTHLAGALTKALTEDVPTYGGPFRIALGMHEQVIVKDDILLPGMVHGVEMLKTGTTTINECWWHQPQSARIIEQVGLRGVVGAEIREVDSSQIGFG